MTDAIKRAAEAARRVERRRALIADVDLPEHYALHVLRAALSDTDDLMDVIANLPCDPSEGCTCTPHGQLHIGEDLAESIAQAVKAHLIGGEGETERRFQAHRAEVHRAYAESGESA